MFPFAANDVQVRFTQAMAHATEFIPSLQPCHTFHKDYQLALFLLRAPCHEPLTIAIDNILYEYIKFARHQEM